MPSESMQNFRTASIPDWAILACFCIVVCLQLSGPLSQKSATFDEPSNLVSGYLSLRYANDRLIPQNLPLVKLLAASPLLLAPDLALPLAPKPWSAASQYRYASRLLYVFNGGDFLLLKGRLAVLPLSLLLGCGMFFWAKTLFGRSAATFALFLYAFEPNVLAHSALITTDIATACFMFFTLFGWYQLMHITTWRRLVLTGVAFGLALISKFTALSLFPILLSVGIVAAIACGPIQIRLTGLAHRTVEHRSPKLMVVCLLMLMLGLLASAVIWAGYGFSHEGAVIPIPTYPTALDESSSSSSSLIRTLLIVARHAGVFPDAYLYGLDHQLRLSGESLAYLMGNVRQGGWWYYFIVTFIVKSPIPLLIFLGLSLPLSWKYWRNTPLVTASLLGSAAIYFILISASGWNIGHRHLLPIHPLLFIVASSLVPWAIKEGRSARLGLAGFALWYALSSVSVFPHYLAYFNELAGGPDKGSLYLVDSNLDWGQDLKGLKRYMDQQGIDQVWLGYFGQASPDYYGIRYNYLPSYDIFDAKNIDESVIKVPSLPQLPGTVAISATLLQVKPDSKSDYFERYRQLTPVAKIGYSIFVFHIDQVAQ